MVTWMPSARNFQAGTMESDPKISVIVPVYNAGRFLVQAVNSALAQPAVGEVILVEDGSPDDSLSVCRELAERNPIVHLYQHPQGANRGAGPSRNLGMQKSNCPLIAFLDADDYYLPGRFSRAVELFQNDPFCDGVYDAVGIYYEDKQARERWLASGMANVGTTMLDRKVEPGELFAVLMKGGSGHIHLDGLVFKRTVLDKAGFMDESIADTLHEDTDFILRLAAVGRLLPGNLDTPTSMRRVHAQNRVSATRSEASIYRDHMRQRVATWNWCKHKGLKEHARLAFRRMLDECVHHKPVPNFILSPRGKEMVRLLSWPFEYPAVVTQHYYWSELASTARNLIKNEGSLKDE